MRRTRWTAALVPFLALALASAVGEAVVHVNAEVERGPNGYLLKVGRQTIPVRAYELPVCLAAGGKVKLALKLEGTPPRVEDAAVAEGPCPRGTELGPGLKERLSAMVRKGYLDAEAEIVREQNRWMLRIGEARVPLDPEELPACMKEDGVRVRVRAVLGVEGELALEKGDCRARVRLGDEERAAMEMAFEARTEQGQRPAGEVLKKAVEKPVKGVMEKIHEVQEGMEKAKDRGEKKAEQPAKGNGGR